MNCIIVDDEPLAREAIRVLIEQLPTLHLLGEFNHANTAAEFLSQNQVSLVFLDIRMPGVDGLTFASTIGKETQIIFTTAYSQYALDSYEIDALDYLLKPVKPARFKKAVDKAFVYQKLFAGENNTVDEINDNYCFIRADRRTIKVAFAEILFIEGLKDYVILHTNEQKIITAMNLKTIHAQLPKNIFIRTSKSYLVNKEKISSFDNTTAYINDQEIPIGNAYRQQFFDTFAGRR